MIDAHVHLEKGDYSIEWIKHKKTALRDSSQRAILLSYVSVCSRPRSGTREVNHEVIYLS